MNTIRSGLIWAAVVLLVLLWLPLMAVVRVFDRDPARYRTGRMFRRLGAATTRVNPRWDITVEGDFPADPRLPYVVVANHQSVADIVILSRLPWEMKWVAKAELFRLPVFGWMMRLACDIPVDRGRPASRARAAKQVLQTLDRKCSVMFFPEGTRSKDGRVRRFQAGAFRTAIEAGVPILPIALDGAMEAIPKHGWRFGPRINVRVRILAEVPTESLVADDVHRLADEVRDVIIRQIAAWRDVEPAMVDAAGPRAGRRADAA